MVSLGDVPCGSSKGLEDTFKLKSQGCFLLFRHDLFLLFMYHFELFSLSLSLSSINSFFIKQKKKMLKGIPKG